MSVNASTTQPKVLLAALAKAIDESQIKTWRYKDISGTRWYTHSADQWDARAWFKATTKTGGVIFNIAPPKGGSITTEVYAIFHGRFIEMLIAHFANMLSLTAASPLPVTGDLVQAA